MKNDMSVKLEVLRMAREIVNNEYIDKRAQDHNKWLADSEKLASRGIKIPYPDIPPYPDESVVISKARSLLGFIGIDDIEDVQPIKRDLPIEVKREPEPPPPPPPPPPAPKIEKVVVEEVTEEVPEKKNTPKTEDDLFKEYVNKRVSYEAEEDTPSSTRMISMLLKQLSDLKRPRK